MERQSTLRFLYDKITVYIRGLASLVIKSEQYGSLLVGQHNVRIATSEICSWHHQGGLGDRRADGNGKEGRETADFVKLGSTNPIISDPQTLRWHLPLRWCQLVLLWSVSTAVNSIILLHARNLDPRDRKAVLLRSGRCFTGFGDWIRPFGNWLCPVGKWICLLGKWVCPVGYWIRHLNSSLWRFGTKICP